MTLVLPVSTNNKRYSVLILRKFLIISTEHNLTE